MGIASFILGLIGFITICIPCLSQLLAILALVFGIIDVAKKGKIGEPRGFAITGIVLSTITLVISIIFAIFSVISATIPFLESI